MPGPEPEPWASWRARVLESPDPAVRAFVEAAETELAWGDRDRDGVWSWVEDAVGTRDDAVDSNGDGVPDAVAQHPWHPLATVLAPDPVWQCSGWVAKSAVFGTADELGPTTLELESWDERGRLVRGTGHHVPLWAEDGARDPACGRAGGVVWLASKTPPPALLAALEAHGVGNPLAPVPLLWGGPQTGTLRGGVRLSDTVVRWAERADGYDALAVAIEILAESAELGVAPDPTLIRDELEARLGDAAPPLDLTAE